MVSANVGDSRAIIVDANGRTKQLSRDHKPDCVDEKERIESEGGRCFPMKHPMTGEDFGPSRVWIGEADVPGLAMSRSLGDYLVQGCGVSPAPEINIYDLTVNDRFIILGSDGVWDYLPNDVVAKMVEPFYHSGDAQGAADLIVEEAHK